MGLWAVDWRLTSGNLRVFKVKGSEGQLVYRVLLGHGYHGYRLTALHGMTRHARPWDPTASWPGFRARVKLMAWLGYRFAPHPSRPALFRKKKEDKWCFSSHCSLFWEGFNMEFSAIIELHAHLYLLLHVYLGSRLSCPVLSHLLPRCKGSVQIGQGRWKRRPSCDVGRGWNLWSRAEQFWANIGQITACNFICIYFQKISNL